MIKDLLNLSQEEFKKFMSQEIRIYEKLDMIYFKVEINKNGVFPQKRPRYLAVSDIDCICNSVYKDIVEFSKKYILPHKKELLNEFGELIIGFFYLPVHKTKIINYYNLPEKTFIISDVNNHNDLDKVYDIIHHDGILKEPLIFKGTLSNELVNKLLHAYNDKSPLEMIKLMNEYDIKPFSNNSLEDIEGYVIKSNNKIYQIKVNNVEPIVEKEITKPYRDIILQSLAKCVNDKLLESFGQNDTYTEKICKTFKYFISSTDVFTKYKIDPSDLMPPIIGYFGDLDLEAFDDEEIKTMCSVSKLCKNILRIFLHTFTTPRILNKFKSMPVKDKENLDKLMQALNYRNYAEITKNL